MFGVIHLPKHDDVEEGWNWGQSQEQKAGSASFGRGVEGRDGDEGTKACRWQISFQGSNISHSATDNQLCSASASNSIRVALELVLSYLHFNPVAWCVRSVEEFSSPSTTNSVLEVASVKRYPGYVSQSWKVLSTRVIIITTEEKQLLFSVHRKQYKKRKKQSTEKSAAWGSTKFNICWRHPKKRAEQTEANKKHASRVALWDREENCVSAFDLDDAWYRSPPPCILEPRNS